MQTVEQQAADAAIEEACLQQVPDFYDIPDELRATIEEEVLRRERLFWMTAGRTVPRDAAARTLLRRAVYAEVRCWEMENRAAEMALIARGAKERVEELQSQLKDTVEATRG